MEIPPCHIPTIKGVMLRTWDRVKTFLFRAGKVIVAIVACLSILNSLGTDGSWGNEDSDNSVLSQIGKTIVPIFPPLGVQEENRPAAVGVFTGILAREDVVGTLNSLYVGIADGKADEEQEVTTGTIDTIRTLFGSTSGAFACLLMVLLCMPCYAAVWREVGTARTIFSSAWCCVLDFQRRDNEAFAGITDRIRGAIRSRLTMTARPFIPEDPPELSISETFGFPLWNHS